MKKRWRIAGLAFMMLLASCRQRDVGGMTGVTAEASVNTEATEREAVSHNSGESGQENRKKNAVVLSNMADSASLEEVRSVLKRVLNEESVEEYMAAVRDYNEAVEYTDLIGAFEERENPEYDVFKMGDLWAEKKGDFIGTNCRINTFILLRRDMEIPVGKTDDSLLSFDNDAIRVGNLFSEEDAQIFRFLFSKVETDAGNDISAHGRRMEAHFNPMRFDEDARMICVVLHDNLDGDFLFVGHVGVLAEHEGTYLFVEKLAFDQPYHAIKFDTPEDCYRYLYMTYRHHHDPTSSKPFLMDNGKFVNPDRYHIESGL